MHQQLQSLHAQHKTPIFWALIAATTLIGCGKSKKSSSTQSNQTAGSSSSLAIAYPEGLSVSTSSTTAPASSSNDPQSVAIASGGLALPQNLELLVTEESYDPSKIAPKTRLVEVAKKLKGEADDCLPPYIFNPAPMPSPNCYNPDGDLSQVNQDFQLGGTGSNPQFPNARGTVAATGEACLAAYSRAKIAEVGQIVDQAQALVEGMICAAYKENAKTSLPQQNETLDLTKTISDITGATRVDKNTDLSLPGNAPDVVMGAPPRTYFRFVKADMTRLENKENRARFLSQIVMEVNGTVRMIRLMHMPSLTSGNNDYIGRLSVRTIRVQRGGLVENFQNYLDMNYMLDLDTTDGSKPKTRYRLLRAMFNHSALARLNKDPFAGIGQLDLNAGANFGLPANDPLYAQFPSDTANKNTTIEKVNRIDYEGNPLTDEGKLSFWLNPGGNYNEAARGLIADRKRETSESTRLIGCAVSGAAIGTTPQNGSISIRKAQREKILLKPSGYLHPKGGAENLKVLGPVTAAYTAACAKGDCQMAGYVYKQCYRQNDDGLFMPTDPNQPFQIVKIADNPGVIDDRLPSVDDNIKDPQ